APRVVPPASLNPGLMAAPGRPPGQRRGVARSAVGPVGMLGPLTESPERPGSSPGPRLVEELPDLCPQRPPGVALGIGEAPQGNGIADAGQVRVLLPVFQRLGDESLRLRRAGFDEPRPDGQLGLEPGEGLLA